MKIQEILDMGPETALKILSTNVRETEIDKWRDEYDGVHAILNKADKQIGDTKTIILSKLVTTFQKMIVNSAVSFLFGDPPTITRVSDDSTQTAFEELRAVFKKNKTDALNRQIARRLFIDTQVAELWYAVKPDAKTPAKIGVLILSGDKIWPHLDDNGDMDAFTRTFQRDISDGFMIKKETVSEIYTAETVITITNSGNGNVITEIPNVFGKIPVVYYEQETPEWDDVQTLIDRIEEVISSHADTNDYFASPLLKAYGEIMTMPDKAATGKMIQFAGVAGMDGKIEYGDASYLTWDQAPETIKLEIENLKELIYSLTHTPDVSFNNVKGLGAVSGIAIKLMFLSAIHKAKNKQEIFGAGLERRVSIVKSLLAFTNVSLAAALDALEVDIRFSDGLPENTAELITTLSTALGGNPVMSMETAVKNNPFVVDADAETALMDEAAAKASVNSIAGSFVP